MNNFLCSRIFPDKEKMVTEALNIAANIAEKSPIAVQGTKTNLVYARDHSVPEGLEYVVCYNIFLGWYIFNIKKLCSIRQKNHINI